MNRSQLSGLGRCPHCGIAAPNMVAASLVGPFKGASPESNEFRYWGLYKCESCGACVMACAEAIRSGGGQYTLSEYVVNMFPKENSVAQELPKSAQRYLEQGYSSIHAPDAAALMAASAVDAMLKDRGLSAGSLSSRIKSAVESHMITSEMGQWAHEIRLEANDVRHSDDESPHKTSAQARQMLEFAAALGDILFVLPARVSRGREKTSGQS